MTREELIENQREEIKGLLVRIAESEEKTRTAMVVPCGYALVPIEPTIEMAESMYFDGEDYTNSKDFDDFKIAWPRLLAVAASGDSQ